MSHSTLTQIQKKFSLFIISISINTTTIFNFNYQIYIPLSLLSHVFFTFLHIFNFTNVYYLFFSSCRKKNKNKWNSYSLHKGMNKLSNSHFLYSSIFIFSILHIIFNKQFFSASFTLMILHEGLTTIIHSLKNKNENIIHCDFILFILHV
jgi:hypothetical protein